MGWDHEPAEVLRIGMVTQAAVSVRRDPGDVLFTSGGDAPAGRARPALDVHL